MIIFPFIELSTEPERIASFVGMGSTIIQAKTPQTDMLQANLAIRALLSVASAGRLGRPLTYFRLPGMGTIDRFYYTAENVDRRTISRFYGYTLEDPGPGALRQFAPYLKTGHMLSADRKIDYSARLGEVTVPALMVAGARDLISDVPSTRMTFDALGSGDKTLFVFSKANGHVADYGHCDLAWSRYAPREVFPAVIAWLDRRQPGVSASRQQPAGLSASMTPPASSAGAEKRVDADL
jgi:pimeloyl-ACP methyl ester carboxylesterase